MTNGLEEHSRAEEVCDRSDEKQRERRDIARKKDMIGEKRKAERDR